MYNEKYVLENIRRSLFRIKDAVYRPVCDLELEIYTSHEPLPYDRRTQGEYRRVKVGDKWGDLFDCAWFHVTGRVPPQADGQKTVLIIDINGEGLIYDRSGCPVRGITNVNSVFDRSMGNPGKRVVQLADAGVTDGVVDFWMDAGCNDLLGNLQENGRIKEAYIATCNEPARELFYDGIVLLTQIDNMPGEDPLRYELIDTLSRCHHRLSAYTDEEYRDCLEITRRQLEKRGGDAGFSLTAFGHAHIDLAWLWPLRETRRKGARTFSTALNLMERYGDYRFAASQAQLYQWIKEDHPALYNKVKKSVEDGRWEIQGAMWVESDANLIAGESFVRQLLYGRRFWEAEFGKSPRYVWMPDTFGYAASMPQIFRKSGITNFGTIKMSWSLINRFPYTNFRWRGIDGSEVLVHMPPEGSYVSEATPRSIYRVRKSLAASGQFGEALLPYGIGDGGGGPSPSHLEYLKREKNLPGLCPIRQGSMQEFFDRLNEKWDAMPVWENEMYLERHLGVYTSAARNKKCNRRMELGLRDAEMLAAFAARLTGATYPADRFEALWKETLLYQFHDILPGSSIQRVYDECLARYAQMAEQTQSLRDAAAAQLAEQVDTSAYVQPAVVFNTLSFPRTCRVATENGTVTVDLPAMGYAVAELAAAQTETPVSVTPDRLENEYLTAEFGDDGSLVRLYSRVLERELLDAPSNLLLLFEDRENAWNLQYDYRNQEPRRMAFAGATATRDANGTCIRQRYTVGQSVVELAISLGNGDRHLTVDVHADWHERDVMLRIAFVPAVHTSTVDCEIPFGYIRRSALDNTTAELAQIEMAAHRWIAVSEPGARFALLNDCKYGYSLHDGVLELNALRGTSYPATDLDQGEHHFRYALYADGDADLTGVIREAHGFNVPPTVCRCSAHAGAWPASDSFLNVGSDHVLIDGVKMAESGDGVIIRTYEATGRRGQVTPDYRRLGERVYTTDLMENGEEVLSGGQPYRPFDIITYKVR